LFDFQQNSVPGGFAGKKEARFIPEAHFTGKKNADLPVTQFLKRQSNVAGLQ